MDSHVSQAIGLRKVGAKRRPGVQARSSPLARREAASFYTILGLFVVVTIHEATEIYYINDHAQSKI